MTLPAHEVRCLDNGCPQHLTCRRFLDRPAGTSRQTPYINTCFQLKGEDAYPRFLAVTPATETAS